MTPNPKWNKFALAATSIFIITWVATNLYNHLVWLVTSKSVYSSSQEAGISGLFELLGVILPYMLVVIFAVIALRKIKVTGEKGKILSWIILVLTLISILLWITTVFRSNRSIRELFTGDSYVQSN